MKIMASRFVVLFFSVSVAQALVASEAGRAEERLRNGVYSIFKVQDGVTIGSESFNDAVLRALRNIGSRRDCLEAIVAGAGSKHIAVDLFADGGYLAVEFQTEDFGGAGEKEQLLISILIQVSWDRSLNASRVSSSLRREKPRKIIPPEKLEVEGVK